MSAWVCSKAHIDAMVAVGISMPGYSGDVNLTVYHGHPGEFTGLSMETADVVGQMLTSTIVTGVSHRYPDDDVEKGELPGPTDGWYLKPYKFARPTKNFLPGEIVGLFNAYGYQACEHAEWEKTFGFAFIAAVEKRMLKLLQEAHEKATGTEVPWGFEEGDVRPPEPGAEATWTVYMHGGECDRAYVTTTEGQEAAGKLAGEKFGGHVIQVALGIPANATENEPRLPETTTPEPTKATPTIPATADLPPDFDVEKFLGEIEEN